MRWQDRLVATKANAGVPRSRLTPQWHGSYRNLLIGFVVFPAYVQSLRRKADERNPDEFYFAMEKKKTKDGVHDGRCVHICKQEQQLWTGTGGQVCAPLPAQCRCDLH